MPSRTLERCERGPLAVRLLLLVLCANLALPLWTQAEEPAPLSLDSSISLAESPKSIWNGEIGDGFRSDSQQFTAAVGAGFGMKVITSRENHDWGVGSLEYGWFLGEVVGSPHWYRGNWQLLVQVFGGVQFYPDTAYVVGAAPLFRYNFATGCRWIPFLDLGAGVAATDIRNGDLSTTFEFNLQAGAGMHYFVRDAMALTFQYRFIHLSNAGLEFPNLGVNSSTFLFGVSWFF
jgi:lipid A 3-O-deacylase